MSGSDRTPQAACHDSQRRGTGSFLGKTGGYLDFEAHEGLRGALESSHLPAQDLLPAPQ